MGYIGVITQLLSSWYIQATRMSPWFMSRTVLIGSGSLQRGLVSGRGRFWQYRAEGVHRGLVPLYRGALFCCFGGEGKVGRVRFLWGKLSWIIYILYRHIHICILYIVYIYKYLDLPVKGCQMLPKQRVSIYHLT